VKIVHYTKFIRILDGNITSNVAATVWTNTDPTGQLILRSPKDLVVSGYVSMPTVFASANASVVISGQLESRKRMNKTDPVEYQLCSIMQTTESILNNYTISLFSSGVITLGEENKAGALTGAALLLCTDSALTVSTNFQLSSSGFGYPSYHGYGHGECVGSLGSGGGYGGDGADSYALRPTKSVMASGGPSYGSKQSTGFLGSGGGCDDAGAGGGVIVLGAHHLNLNGTIAADGVNGEAGSGGGSGGFVSIVVPNGLSGHGSLSASGGNVSCIEQKITFNTSQVLCGGGGGGGQLRLQGCTNFTECASGFSGAYYVDGGKILSKIKLPHSPVGGTGIYYGFPCPPGYGGLLCRSCPVGTFKEERGSVECIACHNAPPNSHYTRTGSISSECVWSCDPGYTGQHCLSPLDDLFEVLGGLMALGLLLIIVGIGYYFKRDPYVKYRPGESDHLFILPKPKSPWYHLYCCNISRWLWPRIGYPKLEGNDLKFHIARLYLSGNNTQSNPLLLRTTVTANLDKVLESDKYADFARDINEMLAFSTSGSIFYKLVQCFCYPFASDVLLYRRHKKFNAVKRYLCKYKHDCMKGPRAKAVMKAIKVGYAADYSLAYIELLHTEYSMTSCAPQNTPIGEPHLPMVLLFAGMGSYESPLYLDPNDLMVRSLPQAPELDAFIDEQLIEIVAELNALLRVVDTSNGTKCMSQLQAVAEFCEDLGDMQNLGGVRMYLGFFNTHDNVEFGYQWGIYLTTTKHVAAKYSGPNNEFKHDIRLNEYYDRGMKTMNTQASANVSSIRNAALMSPRSLAQMAPPPRSTFKPSQVSIPHYIRVADYKGPLDNTLPLAGVLMTSAEFQQHKLHLMEKERIPIWYRLRSMIMPANVSKPPDTKFHGWGVFIALIVLVILDLVTALAMLVNLKCVENGEEVVACTKSVIYPVLLIYPLAILIAPIIGIISLAMGSPSVVRKYALWNSCSYLNVVVAIIICYVKSDKLVALYVTRPLPLLPVTLLLLKIAEGRVVNIYIADIESNRRRRGWRGLMKRRDSDASSPPDSP
ncbi:nucleoside diphosphate kinase, partial [Thraustotheca clavata]